MKSLPIPEDEQLQALADGMKAVYQLLTQYLGDLTTTPLDFRKQITVNRTQLAEYLRRHPELAARHVSKPPVRHYHEFPVLEFAKGKYRVSEVVSGKELYAREFAELADAAAEYLMWDF